MKLPQLFLYIGLAILGFWALNLAFKLATWVAELSLVIGLVLVIIGLINEYYEARMRKRAVSKKK